MRTRTALILAAAAAALSVFCLALSRYDSVNSVSGRARRLFPFVWDNVSAIRLVNSKTGDGGVVLKKSPSGEWLTAIDGDMDDAANPQAMDELSALIMLTWRVKSPDDGGAADPEASGRLEVSDASGGVFAINFFPPSRNRVDVSVDGAPEAVYSVSPDMAKALEWPPERFRSLLLSPGPKHARPEKIVLSPAGGGGAARIELERDEEGWKQAAPVPWEADENRLDSLLRWLAQLRADSVEAEKTGDPAWFGIDESSPFVEVVMSLDGESRRHKVIFGKPDPSGAGVYAQVEGRNPVFLVSRRIVDENAILMAGDYPEEWAHFYRKRVLNLLGDEAPPSLTIERLSPPKSRIVITRKLEKEEYRWSGTLVQDGIERSFPVEPPDPKEPMRPMTALLTGLSNLTVRAFLADREPGPDTARWTAIPAWRITAAGDDGAEFAGMTIYAARPDGTLPPGRPFAEGKSGAIELLPLPGVPERAGFALSVDDAPAVMEGWAELSYLLCLPPYRYQSRRLLDLDASRWDRVEILSRDAGTVYRRDRRGGGEQWWLEDPALPLGDDNNQFVLLLLALSHLQTEGLVADDYADPAEFGLDQPAIRVIVSHIADPGGGGETVLDLAVGKEYRPEDGGEAESFYARLDGGGPVFLLPKSLAGALTRTYR